MYDLIYDKDVGKMIWIGGCMFGGKTTKMIEYVKQYNLLGLNTIIIKKKSVNEKNDIRGEEKCDTVVTHSGNNASCVRVNKLFDLENDINKYDVFGIDDAHFYKDDLIPFCKMIVETYNKIVIVAGLITDFNKDPFQHVVDLSSKADVIHHERSICLLCKHNFACFSYKKIEFNKSNKFEVGGEEMYGSACRKCYERVTKKR